MNRYEVGDVLTDYGWQYTVVHVDYANEVYLMDVCRIDYKGPVDRAAYSFSVVNGHGGLAFTKEYRKKKEFDNELKNIIDSE